MLKSQYILYMLVFEILILASCSGSSSDFNYFVSPSGSMNANISGGEFVITTDNCGAQVNAKEHISRSRTFQVVLDLEITESISGALGGELVAKAEIQAAIEVQLGLQVGVSETIEVEREIETPANSISKTTLQWEELWDMGTITIQRKDGSLISEIPYRVLTTILLTQKGKEDLSCNSPSGPTFLPVQVTSTLPSTQIILPSKTPTPFPTLPQEPTPTIDADRTVYDNFNNPAYDGKFNDAQWYIAPDISAPQEIFQQNGILIIQKKNLPNQSIGLDTLPYSGFTLPNLNLNGKGFFVEAMMQLDANENAGSVYLNLGAILPNGNMFLAQCHNYGSDAEYINCWDVNWDQQQGEGKYESEGKSSTNGVWHKVRIEVDPQMRFTYSIDGEIVGSHIPLDSEQLKEATFWFGIRVWSGDSETTIGYFDDVRFGQLNQ